jgi:hypothetical protein
VKYKLADPLHYASGYTLDLYCDHHNTEHEFGRITSYYGNTFSDCARQARADGWKIHRETHTATCPKCVRG